MSWLFQSTTAEVYPRNLTVEVYPLASCSEPSITSLRSPHLPVALVTSNDLPPSRLSRPDYATPLPLSPGLEQYFLLQSPVHVFAQTLGTRPTPKSSAILLHSPHHNRSRLKLEPEPRCFSSHCLLDFFVLKNLFSVAKSSWKDGRFQRREECKHACFQPMLFHTLYHTLVYKRSRDPDQPPVM